MRHIVVWALALGILFATVGTQEASAFSFGGTSKALGGKITRSTRATNIESIENSNYKCTVAGSSFSLKPVGTGNSTTNYMVPAGTTSRTRNMMQEGQWLLGMFNISPTTITCVFQGTPPNEQTTDLNSVSLYGTSKQ